MGVTLLRGTVEQTSVPAPCDVTMWLMATHVPVTQVLLPVCYMPSWEVLLESVSVF